MACGRRKPVSEEWLKRGLLCRTSVCPPSYLVETGA